MDLLCRDGIVVRIDDPSYSPYLRGIMAFGLNRDMEDGLYRIPYSSGLVRIYRDFLEGDTPRMNEEIDTMFEFMGHKNKMGYLLDYWPIKLHDNWIRDQMYAKDLWQDPYYDLVKVPIVRSFPQLGIRVERPPGVYIAGGLAAWMAGFTSDYSDVDYFFTNEDALKTMLMTDYTTIIPDFWDQGDDLTLTMEIRFGDHAIDLVPYRPGFNRNTWSREAKHQLILRLYKAPTEIVHGFDIDICGVLWDGQDLWATKRAIYAAQNRVNWFDPDRASPSYAYRLSKYMTRGIEVGLVSLNPDLILVDRVRDMWMKIQKGAGVIYPTEDIHAMGQLFFLALESIPSDTHALKKRASKIDKKILKTIVPRDSASILILASLYHFHTGTWKSFDYDTTYVRPLPQDGEEIITYPSKTREIEDALAKVQWRVQDPMDQITSTFNPMPLNRIGEWWMQSPLINPGLPWPRVVQPE